LVPETNPKVNPRGQGSVTKLKATAEKRGWKFKLLNAGKPFAGYCQKHTAVAEYIKKNKPKNSDLLVVTDGRDVLVNRHKSQFETAFTDEYKDCVVYGTEQECCVEVMYEYPPGSFLKRNGRGRKKAAISGPGWDTGETARDKDGLWMEKLQKKVPASLRGTAAASFPYLNGGLAGGTVKAWKAVLAAMQIMDTWEDDQALLTELFLMKPKLVKLDYSQRFFSNSNVDRKEAGCFYTWDSAQGSYVNDLTGTMPFFIQTPGAKNDFTPFGCYMRMYARLKKARKGYNRR